MDKAALLETLLPYRGQVIAVVGSGGKSSLLAWMARAFPGKVWLSTTTHLAGDQDKLAEGHTVFGADAALPAPDALSQSRTWLFTGPADNEGKWTALSAVQQEELVRQAKENAVTLVFEADGSRGRPLKAPAPHEPALPPGCELVLLAAGLAGLGKPLSADWVHRPGEFARISGINLGEEVTPIALARVLALYPNRGQAMPSHVLVLNQLDELRSEFALEALLTELNAHTKWSALWAGSLRKM